MRLAALATTAAGFAATALLLQPAPASACGGFFCSQVPIDQMGEQIIFGVGDGTITAQIQIAYTGEAQDFAWVLPVASKPELSVGSQQAFTTIANMTRPNWRLEWIDDGSQCGQQRWLSPGLAEFDSAGGADTDEDGAVNVLAQQEVGPYDTVVLESSSTEELVKWLDDNGFDQPPESTPLIAHYVDAGMLFVALKLKQNEGTGAIQPIVLEFSEPDPCIPLVLTQVAAVPDMPVSAYIVSEHRMAPTNWMHVVLNEKKVDWLNFGSNYVDVVTQAVNEAAGHGFVTEYAGTSQILEGRLYSEDRYNLAALGSLTDPAAFVDQLLRQGFPRDTTMQGLMRKHIPMPQSLVDDGVDERSFYNNLASYSAQLAGLSFDPAAFVADLEERVIAPLRLTQELFDSRPYLTRLFTTVSPDEMTRDPLFAQNADLGDVDNSHAATAQAICDDDDPTVIDRVIITLDSGELFEVDGQSWITGGPTPDPAPTEPAAKRIELVGRSGAPTLVDPSQVVEVDRRLDTQTPEDVLSALTDDTIPKTIRPPVTDGGGSTGCAAGGAAPLALLGLALFGMLLYRRRQGA